MVGDEIGKIKIFDNSSKNNSICPNCAACITSDKKETIQCEDRSLPIISEFSGDLKTVNSGNSIIIDFNSGDVFVKKE